MANIKDVQAKFYNEKQKNEFIECQIERLEIDDHKKLTIKMTNLFNSLAPYEAKLKKDFCEFNYDEFLEVINEVLNGSPSYSVSIYNTMKLYVKWCETYNKVCYRNILLSIDISQFYMNDYYATKMIKDEENLVTIEDIAFPSIVEDSRFNMYRLYFHLLFLGLSSEDAFALKTKDVYLKSRAIKLPNKIVKISDISFEVIKYVMEMDTIMEVFSGKLKALPIYDTEYVVRTKAKDSTRKKIRNTMESGITNAFKSVGIQVRAHDVLLSGIFYRMYLNEKATGTIDTSEYVTNRFCKNNECPELRRIEKDCLQGYRNWKKTFDL